MARELPNGWLAIDYEMGEDPFIWRDSISGPAEVIEKMTEIELAAEKQRRYDAWLAVMRPDGEDL